MTKNKKKVFIGIPCFGTVAPEILEDWMRWTYHLGRRLTNYDFFLGIKTKSEQFRARNSIVTAARQIGADYLLMLDDDMIIDIDKNIGESSSYSFIDKLINHGKDICGALYYHRGGECRPIAMMEYGTAHRFLRDDEITHSLQEVDVAGGGCLMIDMKVFDGLKEPYFAPEFEYGTDIQLCKKAKEAGFSVFIDSSIEFGHLKNERSIVTSRNRHIHMAQDMVAGEESVKFVTSEILMDLVEDAKKFTGYNTIDEMVGAGNSFMDEWEEGLGPEEVADWYRKYPNERVARQVAYLTQTAHKKQLLDTVLQSVSDAKPYRILDFGCGTGTIGYELAKRGHDVHFMDIKDTATFKFLQWRIKENNLKGIFIDSHGGPPVGLDGNKFDVIIAMDSIEHIEDWPEAVRILADRLDSQGVMFSNNGILDDQGHPEHFPLKPKDFQIEMIKNGLQPVNQITYIKQGG